MSNRLEIIDTPLAGLKLIQRKPIGDSRGYFERLFCASELQCLLEGKSIHQINHSLTVKRGSVRGMHFQHPPYAEIKVVSCIKGAVFDVAVDLRRNSPTFMRWHGEVLTSGNHRSLFIPEGFAHGFQTLEDGCELLYFHTMDYMQSAEGGLNARASMPGIQWPEEITDLSARDAALPSSIPDFSGLTI